MTSKEIERTTVTVLNNTVEVVLNFYLREIAYQLAVSNELQIERNKELKRSVDLQEEAFISQNKANKAYSDIVDSLLNDGK